MGDGKKVNGVAWSPTGAALAYTVDDDEGEDHQGGLYIAEAPGEPGELFIRGRLMPPVCCSRQPFPWASDNSLLLGRIEDMKTVLLVTLSGP